MMFCGCLWHFISSALNNFNLYLTKTVHEVSTPIIYNEIEYLYAKIFSD